MNRACPNNGSSPSNYSRRKRSSPSKSEDMPDPDDPTRDRRHTLRDHLQGADHEHSHDTDEAHDHDHDHLDPGTLEHNPIWLQDHITLTSVGIDIGSAGTQIIFSRLNMRRPGENLSSRYF